MMHGSSPDTRTFTRSRCQGVWTKWSSSLVPHCDKCTDQSSIHRVSRPWVCQRWLLRSKFNHVTVATLGQELLSASTIILCFCQNANISVYITIYSVLQQSSMTGARQFNFKEKTWEITQCYNTQLRWPLPSNTSTPSVLRCSNVWAKWRSPLVLYCNTILMMNSGKAKLSYKRISKWKSGQGRYMILKASTITFRFLKLQTLPTHNLWHSGLCKILQFRSLSDHVTKEINATSGMEGFPLLTRRAKL